MGFARAADVPVVIVGDIDRGGVIASLVGTHAVLDPADAALVVGFVVNRMRGDPSLFADGMATIAARTGWRALGLVPFFADARLLPAEDAEDAGRRAAARCAAAHRRAGAAVDREFRRSRPAEGGAGRRSDAGARRARRCRCCDLVILPGSKATIADLAALRAAGWDIDLLAHRRRGGRILGLCGGYQMLGRSIADPRRHRGRRRAVSPGSDCCRCATVLGGDKRLVSVSGHSADGIGFTGYEMHVGTTDRRSAAAAAVGGRTDGWRGVGRRAGGGVLCPRAVRRRCAARGVAAASRRRAGRRIATRRRSRPTLDALAAHLERHMRSIGCSALASMRTARQHRTRPVAAAPARPAIERQRAAMSVAVAVGAPSPIQASSTRWSP